MTRIRQVRLILFGAAGLFLAGGCVVGGGDGGPVPTAPAILGATPASPSSDPSPRIFGQAEVGTTVSIFLDSSCASVAVATGTAEQFASPGLVVPVRPNVTNQIFATATNSFGKRSPCSPNPFAYQHDDIAPSFSGVGAAIGVTGTQITLSWEPAIDSGSASDQISYEICVVPSGSSGGCESFVSTTRARAGATMWNVGGLQGDTEYDVAVRAVDAAGNVDQNPTRIRVRTTGIPGPGSVTAGGWHSCSITASGTVQCWGWNVQGQLGSETVTAPEEGGTSGPDDGPRDVEDVLAAVRSTRPVAVSGLSSVVELTAGALHTCAREASGVVSCWGNNSIGQLGVRDPGSFSVQPVKVSGLSGLSTISAGAWHTCATQSSGEVWCWGANESGQIGDGSAIDRSQPVRVDTGEPATSVVTGDAFSCALAPSGTVRCWGLLGFAGENQAGKTPLPVAGLERVIAIASGANHVCALQLGGAVRCWGSNGNGELGSAGWIDQAAPPLVADLSGGKSLALGAGHSCAILDAGSTVCWGAGALGQLGDGSKEAALAPVSVANLAEVAAIAAGGGDYGIEGGHSCAAVAAGTVKCWGRNDYGQLGDGTLQDRPSPVAVQ